METGGTITTAESSFTGNELMPQPSSSGTTIGIDDGRAVTTTDAAFAKDTHQDQKSKHLTYLSLNFFLRIEPKNRD